ncbi:MAG: TolC family protein [Kiritimatiellae bacterium]|nr:TolC family protein [Kiritimatiellia bacterium]
MNRFFSCGIACAALAFAAALLSGCASFDAAEARRDQTDAFSVTLQGLADEHLAKPLSLDDCIRVAMTNNYDVRTVELDRKLGKLARDLSFTAFLPQVSATAGYTWHAKEPMMQERRATAGTLDAGVPLFMPSSWFLYSLAKHGQASVDTAAAYVRQSIVLQTTADYFALRVQQETVAALASQAEAARAYASRVEGLASKGFFMGWERDQAVYLAEAREAELNRARRQLDVVRGNLLVGLGLSPLSPVALSGDIGTAARPAGDVTNLVMTALSVHPELAIADRAVVMGEERVRMAFCNFLPTVSFASSLSWTTDDLAKHSANWMNGLSGAWTLFSGFANMARYREAKVERARTELERETAFLSVMIRVMSASAAFDDAVENARLLQRAYDVAKAKFEDYDAKANEGLLPLSDALDARSEMDAAQVALLRGTYAERMAIAHLELAMGITKTN